jgi:glycosyltransferase involved in cell wall biosynthesis
MQLKFFIRNLIDALDAFFPLGDLKNATGKKILIFNWRDIRHTFSGGAEVYIHEIAKRLVNRGNTVTVFCGNDSSSPRNETIDGVHVVRRGGFYFVYIWAFLYYLLRFRGRYDVILDSQNGIPFFTPLYASEPIISLMFHVHQEVFYHDLSKPLAQLASFIEAKLMPWAYKHTRFITISKSTQLGMQKLGITDNKISIVSPGVDLTQFKPGQKSAFPQILYFGRLKQYKSVDVLINSFAALSKSFPTAKLIIAGDGEERDILKDLSTGLHLSRKTKFLGRVTESQKVSLMQSSWVLVNPSIMEGWGITVLEANACGTVAIASQVPGLSDSVQDRKTGLLFKTKDILDLTAKITYLLKNNNVRKRMQLSALSWSKQFDWEIEASKFLRLI